VGIAADRPGRNSSCALCDGNRVVVVQAFVKKTPKTPRAEIELALKRAR
jgi:phage-related protein